MSSLHTLTDDIVFKILEILPVKAKGELAKTCQRFSDLVADPSAWPVGKIPLTKSTSTMQFLVIMCASAPTCHRCA